MGKREKRVIGWWISGLAAAWSVAGAAGDTITLKDGRTFKGDVVAEDARSVTLSDAQRDTALTLKRKLTKANIARWERPAQEGPGYVRIPVVGEIGKETTAEGVKAALEAAKATKPAYVVLVIDSDGGRIDEMAQIIDLVLDGSKEYRTVAYVKKAYSAAAVIGMACRELYMQPGGAIGAVVPFRVVNGAPEDVEAKFRSALEAKIRATAAEGGHADLLMRGMSEMDLELYVNTVNGRPVVSENGPGKKIKSRGQILSLTSIEAAEAGLAREAADLREVGKGITGGAWHETSEQPWEAALGAAASQKQRMKEIVRAYQSAQKIASRGRRGRVAAADPKEGPEVVHLEQQAAAAMSRAAQANQRVQDLEIAYAATLSRIKEEYEGAIRSAPASGSAANLAKAKADEDRRSRTLAARKEFREKAEPARQEGLAALQEAGRLKAKAAELAEVLAGK